MGICPSARKVFEVPSRTGANRTGSLRPPHSAVCALVNSWSFPGFCCCLSVALHRRCWRSEVSILRGAYPASLLAAQLSLHVRCECHPPNVLNLFERPVAVWSWTLPFPTRITAVSLTSYTMSLETRLSPDSIILSPGQLRGPDCINFPCKSVTYAKES